MWLFSGLRVLFLAVILALMGGFTAQGEEHDRQISVSVEPLAYVFDGAGIHLAYQPHQWRYTVEAFTLTVPRSLHGNGAFNSSMTTVELHIERFFTEDRSGFFLGPEVAVGQSRIEHRESGDVEENIQYSVAARGGYRWYPGWSDFYFNPVAGLSVPLNSEDVTTHGETFESGAFTPWATIGLGWSFDI